jgi:hypothetical protein
LHFSVGQLAATIATIALLAMMARSLWVAWNSIWKKDRFERRDWAVFFFIESVGGAFVYMLIDFLVRALFSASADPTAVAPPAPFQQVIVVQGTPAVPALDSSSSNASRRDAATTERPTASVIRIDPAMTAGALPRHFDIPLERREVRQTVDIRASLNGTPSTDMRRIVVSRLDQPFARGVEVEMRDNWKDPVVLIIEAAVRDLEPVYGEPAASASLRWELRNKSTDESLDVGSTEDQRATDIDVASARDAAVRRALGEIVTKLKAAISHQP